MDGKKPKKTPKFPDSYIDKNADEYDNQKWMERNQRRTTILSVQYLFDEKLDNLGEINILKKRPYLILDLGCGTGFSSSILIECGFRVIGVDILPDMLNKAKEKKKNLNNYKNLDLILADINYLPLKENSIDQAISISAYNFIIHDKQELNEKRKAVNNTSRYLYKILKKNGRIIIEFYPKDDKELNLFIDSFINNDFNGFVIKKSPLQKSGQTFLLLKKERWTMDHGNL